MVPKFRSVSSIVMARENRNGQQKQERRDKHRPDEERHLVKRHAGVRMLKIVVMKLPRQGSRYASQVQREDRQIIDMPGVPRRTVAGKSSSRHRRHHP